MFVVVSVDTSSTHHSLIDLGPSSPNGGGITIKREPVEHKPLLHNILSAQPPHLGPGHVSLLMAHRTNAYTTNTNGKLNFVFLKTSYSVYNNNNNDDNNNNDNFFTHEYLTTTTTTKEKDNVRQNNMAKYLLY